MQSGTALTMPIKTVSETQPLFDALYKSVNGPPHYTGVARVNYLRTKTVAELLDGLKAIKPPSIVAFQPVLDGVVIPKHPQMMGNERGACLSSCIIGTTRDEGTIYGYSVKHIKQFERLASLRAKGNVGEALSLHYPENKCKYDKTLFGNVNAVVSFL